MLHVMVSPKVEDLQGTKNFLTFRRVHLELLSKKRRRKKKRNRRRNKKQN